MDTHSPRFLGCFELHRATGREFLNLRVVQKTGADHSVLEGMLSGFNWSENCQAGQFGEDGERDLSRSVRRAGHACCRHAAWEPTVCSRLPGTNFRSQALVFLRKSPGCVMALGGFQSLACDVTSLKQMISPLRA